MVPLRNERGYVIDSGDYLFPQGLTVERLKRGRSVQADWGNLGYSFLAESEMERWVFRRDDLFTNDNRFLSKK